MLRRDWMRSRGKVSSKVLLVVAINCSIFGAILLGVIVWRFETFARTTATILSVHEEERSGKGGTWVVTVGALAFERRAPSGEIIPCRTELEIGRPYDGYMAGDTLEIIPATSTCDRADIIGRAKPEL